MNEFFKFPSTPHLLADDTLSIRDDKVMSDSECKEFLVHEITVEEKVDGANLGISFDDSWNIRIQNRGAYLNPSEGGQWKHLKGWLNLREEELLEVLTNRYILFGEWCYARHSVTYSCLPDWLLGFDIYDKSAKRFLSALHRNTLLNKMGIAIIPLLGSGRFTIADLKLFFAHSKLGDNPAEGIYLRWDSERWLEARAKWVRPCFIQAIDHHWTRSQMQPNQLIFSHVKSAMLQFAEPTIPYGKTPITHHSC